MGARRPVVGDGTPRGGRHVAPQPAADARQVRAHPLSREDPGDALGDRRVVERPALGRDGRDRDAPRRPGRSTRRSASRRLTSGRASSDRPSRWSTSNARNAAGGPLAAGEPRLERGRIRAAVRHRPRPARRRAAPTARRPGPPCRRARGMPPTGPPRPRRRPGPRRSPAASAGPIPTSTRRPPHHGSKRCSSESNASGSGRGSIGRRSGRSGRRSVSSRSESWSDIVARW